MGVVHLRRVLARRHWLLACMLTSGAAYAQSAVQHLLSSRGISIDWLPCAGRGGCPGGLLRVRDRGRQMLQINTQLNQDEAGLVAFASNDKGPEFMVPLYSGGAHCCTTLAFFWTTPYRVVELPIQDSIYRIVHDAAGHLVVRFYDFNFRYWRTDFADSPAPALVFWFDPETGALVPDMALMRKPPPTQADFRKARDAWRTAILASWGGHGGNVDWITGTPAASGLPSMMLNYIYSGNPAAARAYLDYAWPSGHTTASKKDFLDCFSHQLNDGTPDSLWRIYGLSKLFGATALFPDRERNDHG